MSGHSRKYKIMLTNEERNQLKEVLRSNKTCNTIKKRCQILLALDCNTNLCLLTWCVVKDSLQYRQALLRERASAHADLESQCEFR